MESHRKRLREAFGNTMSDEFVDVLLGKLAEALRPGLGRADIWHLNKETEITTIKLRHTATRFEATWL
jgi:hypothetical protein